MSSTYHPVLHIQQYCLLLVSLKEGYLQTEFLGFRLRNDGSQLLVVSDEDDLLRLVTRQRNESLRLRAHAALVDDALGDVGGPREAWTGAVRACTQQDVVLRDLVNGGIRDQLRVAETRRSSNGIVGKTFIYYKGFAGYSTLTVSIIVSI